MLHKGAGMVWCAVWCGSVQEAEQAAQNHV